MSNKLSWHISLKCYDGLQVVGICTVGVYVYCNTNGNFFDKSVGVTSELKILDWSNKIIKNCKGYYRYNGSAGYNGSIMSLFIKLEDIPLECLTLQSSVLTSCMT